MELKNKKILVISPSKWGTIYISKHHYSIELAQLGNDVYYLEPATKNNNKETKVWQPLPDLPNLRVIRTYMPAALELLRFKFRPLYDLILPQFISGLLKKINVDFDITWCFETNLYSNLRAFKAPYVIYHPVDVGAYRYQRKIAATADIVFSISESIAEAFKPYNKKVFFVNHGLSNPFADEAAKTLDSLKSDKKIVETKSELSAGFVGNLFRTDLNREFISSLVVTYPTITFHVWGPDDISKSNVDGELSERTLEFINLLKNAPNVILHGVKYGAGLASELRTCDILLLALNNSLMYDGSNSHKIIEYLSTGKTIVSHYVNTYANSTLLEMAKDDATENLLKVFYRVYTDIENFNSLNKQIERIEFALQNTYWKQIQFIEKLIN